MTEIQTPKSGILARGVLDIDELKRSIKEKEGPGDHRFASKYFSNYQKKEPSEVIMEKQKQIEKQKKEKFRKQTLLQERLAVKYGLNEGSDENYASFVDEFRAKNLLQRKLGNYFDLVAAKWTFEELTSKLEKMKITQNGDAKDLTDALVSRKFRCVYPDRIETWGFQELKKYDPSQGSDPLQKSNSSYKMIIFDRDDRSESNISGIAKPGVGLLQKPYVVEEDTATRAR